MEEDIQKIFDLIDSYKKGKTNNEEEEFVKNKPSSDPVDFNEMKKSAPENEGLSYTTANMDRNIVNADLFRYDLKTLERIKTVFDFYSDSSSHCLGYKFICERIQEIKNNNHANT